MRYMEVYPNTTTMMALTTFTVTVDWQNPLAGTNSEDVKDPIDESHHQEAFSVDDTSIASIETADVASTYPSRITFSYDPAKEISDILEKTFCA